MSEPRPPCAHSLFEPRFESPTRRPKAPSGISQWDLRSSHSEVAAFRVGSRGLPSGKSQGAEWEVEWPRVAFRNPIENCKFPIPHYQLAADSSHDSPRTGCSPFPRPRRWALALRPEHHPRSDQSGHAEQPACRTPCPKELHAQRSWHLQRSPPAQSEDLPPEVWLAESLRRRAAQSRSMRDYTALDESLGLSGEPWPLGCRRGADGEL